MGTTRRAIAVTGAAVAVGAAALMTAGVAAADAPGRCAENVNVRAEPSIDAPIVAVCEAGTAVTTGRVSDGFVELTDLDGWAAAEYVEVDGRRVGAPGSTPAPGPGDDDSAEDGADDPVDGRTGDDEDGPADERPGSLGGEGAVPTAEPYDDPLSSADDRPAPEPERGPLGGLL
jgi:hypothetical protein